MQIVSYAVDTRYIISDNGVDPASINWKSSAQTQYRPDRYTDAILRFNHEHEKAVNKDNTRLEIIQKYSYNFFTRKGVIRNVATLTEEYSFVKQDITNTVANNFNGKTQYLMISGRYSPTDRYTLFGSVKYQKADPPGSVTMYYNAGMSADFRLLSTSIDYTLAKRDIDNRVEKKLAASVRRSF